MGEIEPSDLRISDTEREQAVRLLGEHMSVGRLDVEEYGERSARATAAKTRREVIELFADLPEPKPKFGGTVSTPPPYEPAASAPEAAAAPASTRFEDQPLAQRLWKAMVPLSAIIAVILFFTVFRVWFVFLLPAAVAVIGGAVWGDDWRNDNREIERRVHRRQLRRGWHD